MLGGGQTNQRIAILFGLLVRILMLLQCAIVHAGKEEIIVMILQRGISHDANDSLIMAVQVAEHNVYHSSGRQWLIRRDTTWLGSIIIRSCFGELE